MNKLNWKEGDIRCLYAEYKTGDRFIITGTDSYECAVAVGEKETKTIGFSETLEGAKKLHEKDISRKLEKKGPGDEFVLG